MKKPIDHHAALKALAVCLVMLGVLAAAAMRIIPAELVLGLSIAGFLLLIGKMLYHAFKIDNDLKRKGKS